MVKDVAHPNVKIMIDTFHMNIEENSFEEAIRAGGESIFHVHARAIGFLKDLTGSFLAGFTVLSIYTGSMIILTLTLKE